MIVYIDHGELTRLRAVVAESSPLTAVLRAVEERDRLHAILVQCAYACGGAACPESSIDFLSNIPEEIRLRLAKATP